MNAPMQIPVDIHDNTINNGPQGGQGGYDQTFPSDEEWADMFPSEDPNAEQDVPDSWDESDVDTPEPVPLPTPIS